MIKWIISDIDGTLLNHERKLPERNFLAIQKAQQQGVKFGIATGRDITAITFMKEQHGIDVDVAILGNGAQVIDRNGQFLAQCYLNADDFLQVVKILTQANLPYMVYTKTGVYALDVNWVRDSFIARSMAKHGTTLNDYKAGGSLSHIACMRLNAISDVIDFSKREDIIKIESFSLNINQVNQTKERLSTISSISCLSSFSDNIEITDALAQKGVVLENILQKIDATKEEVVVIGDALNDISLFEQFPLSFAPENAMPIIKEKAFKVVTSNNAGAVADVIEWALEQH